MNFNELYRLICNLIRIGTVSEVDTVHYVARVTTGGNVTNWIRWNTQRAGDAITWWSPSVGEQVWIVCPGGNVDTAFIGGSLYSDSALPPDSGATSHVTQYPDGARIAYDPASGALEATGITTADINASQSISASSPEVTVTASTRITLDTPEVICTNKITAVTMNITGGGDMSGDITHSGGSLSSNGIVLSGHKHTGVDTGSGTSGGPV